MKTKFFLPAALIFLTCFFSCSKDELQPNLDESSLADDVYHKTYNNGMIKSYSNETIITWNEFIGTTIDERIPIPLEAKIYAMVTISMHDALNNVVPVYETYALNNSAVNASDISKKNITHIADAAVSQAARDIMIALFPSSTVAANNLLNTILDAITDDALRMKGVEIGQAAATAMLQKRSGDFPFLFTAYVPTSNDPGVYQANFPPYMFPNPPIWPANAVYTSNLGNLIPFGITSSDQFLNEGPHAVGTSEYATDYNEVKTLGCTACPDRTPEQTEIGTFWVENMASSINRIARTLILQREMDGWEAARLIALLEMGVMDSFIASFKEKQAFVSWAPITAIRVGDTDGNTETIGDATWNARRTTPPVFEFPSTQAYGSGAASELFRLFFNTDQISFTAISPYYLPGVERSFSSFSDFSTEHAESRIFLGHHFRNSIVVGEQHGLELGSYVFENNLRKL